MRTALFYCAPPNVASVKARTRPKAADGADMAAQWRMRWQVLEERLEDVQRAHSALQEQYGELSADYRHVLNRLWKQSAGLTTRRERG